MVGGDYVQRNLDALAVDGRLVQIARSAAPRRRSTWPPILQRRLTMTGSTLRARSVAEKGAIARALREHVWPLLESGAVRPVVFATFPLRDAAEAHRLMESSAHIGKLVLVGWWSMRFRDSIDANIDEPANHDTQGRHRRGGDRRQEVTVHYTGWLYDEAPPTITARSSTARAIAASRSRSGSAPAW